jgi:monoamine oxidase
MVQQIRRGTKVIVVGAGLAGLTAAVRLKEMGAKVSLIEARNRVGGRVLTIRGAFAQEANMKLYDWEKRRDCLYAPSSHRVSPSFVIGIAAGVSRPFYRGKRRGIR